MKTSIPSNSIGRVVSVSWALPWCLGVFAFMFVVISTDASVRNGNFTNNAAGWVGTGGGAGAPRVATNGSTIVVQIGTNAVAGVPGIPKGRLTQNNFVCDPIGGGNFCVVTFTATFTQAPGEKAKVTLESELGSNSREIPSGGPATQSISLDKTCQLGAKIEFAVVPAKPGAAINSLLEVSAVSSQCGGLPNNTMNTIAAVFDDPQQPMNPMPGNMHATGSGFAVLQPGWAPLAVPYQNGSNFLDNVVHAANNSVLAKWNSTSGAFVYFLRTNNLWQPPGGYLLPGEAAFLHNPSNTLFFTYLGSIIPLPFLQNPSVNSNFFANSQPWAAPISEVIGTPVTVGDTISFYTAATADFLTPQWVYPVNDVTVQNLPLVPAGAVVEVVYAPPTNVPLTAAAGDGFGIDCVTIRSVGGLPRGGLLQQMDKLGDIPLSLYGVAGFYQDPADGSHRFFREDFTPPTNHLNIHVVAADHATPAVGVTLQEAPNGTVTTTDANGDVSFTDLAAGKTVINSFFDVYTEIDLQTNKESEPLPFVVELDTNSPPGTVDVIMDPTGQVTFKVGVTNCTCAPWAGILGGTINGVQKVVAGGGVTPKGCVDLGAASVTITGPGGININLGSGGRRTFDPAANGTWTVTAIACGLTKTATITLP